MSKITRREALGLGAAAIGAGVVGSSCGTPSQAYTPVSRGLVPEGHVAVPAKTIPVLAETDVLVLGGGPAGLSAALAAAREGVHTTLVERYNALGGVITQQTMGSISWYRFAETVDAGGLLYEYEKRAKEMGATLDVFGEEARGAVPDFMMDLFQKYLKDIGLRVDGVPTYEILETELFKWVADTLVKEAGVVPIMHCWAVDVIMEGPTITGVITESKSGCQAILAKRVIDCTGDADVAHFAGAPYRQSGPAELMEATMQFGLSGAGLSKLLMYLFLNSGTIGDPGEIPELTPILVEPYRKAKEAGEIPEEDDVDYMTMFGTYTALGELPDMNTIHLHGVDPTDVLQLTAAEMKGRERAIWAIKALKKYAPGLENARLRTFAPALGVRELRKITGRYEITEHDVYNQAQFADSIGICPEFIDGYGIMHLPTTGRYFQVPYGIMVPQGVENLLVAGRAVAGDRISHAATRGMACCCVTGQGAGVAAAVSLHDNVRIGDVDVTKAQRRLEAQGVRVE